MKTKLTLLLVVVVFLLSCGLPSSILPAPTLPIRPTVMPACISPEPVQADIDRALAYTGAVFDSPNWERSYSVSESRVSVTWLNDVQGSVAYLEALIFPCGYEDLDLDEYFSDVNWGVIFENYESYEMAVQCETNDGLRLYEFDATFDGFDYLIHYWVKNDTATRVIVIMMTYPLESEVLLDEVSARLYPRLTSCS